MRNDHDRDTEEKTFQDLYYVTEPGILRLVLRNISLLLYILKMLWMWKVVGGRVRCEYERCEKTGETYYIDHLSGDNY